MGTSGKIEWLAVSVMLTAEEYIDFYCALRRSRRRQIRWANAVRFGGAALALALALLQFVAAGLVIQPQCLLFLLLIPFSIFGVDGMLGWQDRVVAAARYQEQEELRQSAVLRFYEDTLMVNGGQVEGLLPKQWMSEPVETELSLGARFGQEYTLVVPKRMLNEQQMRQLREWIGVTP